MAISNLLLSQMQCIDCDGKLLTTETKNLICGKCKRVYSYVEPGYFDFTATISYQLSRRQINTTSRWNIHWHKIGHLDKFMTSQETNYFSEILPEAFKKKIVLDVGCGTGRNLEKYLREQPAVLVMIDVSDSITTALNSWLQNKNKYRNVEVAFIKCDLHRLPFDSAGNIPIVYTSCGVFNIFKDQNVCIKEAMRFSQYIFILFNSPENIFGKIYYGLNPIRIITKKAISSEIFRFLLSKILSYCLYPIIKIFVRLLNKEISASFQRETLEFLINDWLFTSPQGIAYGEKYYQEIEKEKFEPKIFEKTISRIIFYKRI